jgi:hypothetical protein
MSALTPGERVLLEVMAYYSRELGDFEAKMWQAVMADLGDARFTEFLQHHVQNSPFAPRISDAKQWLGVARSAHAAFAEMEREVGRVGPYGDPSFSDPAIPRVVAAMGGWVAVNQALPSSVDHFAYEQSWKRFEALYSSHAHAQGEAPKIHGLHSISHTTQKNPIQLTHVVAAQDSGQEVFETGASDGGDSLEHGRHGIRGQLCG